MNRKWKDSKKKYSKVLDHDSIELMDWMGDDSDIVKATRISTGGSTETLVYIWYRDF